MGVMCSWVAIQGAAKDEILEALKLAETGAEVLPGERRALFCCREFRGEWLVIFSEDFEWATPELTAELSRFGLAMGCKYEDKVAMTSAIWAMRDGAEAWSLFHDTTKSIYRLDVAGEPPIELAAIRERYVAEQDADGGEEAGVDHIGEIPPDLSKALCGFRMYEGDDVFIELQPPGRRSSVKLEPIDQTTRATGFWARLFGRR
jgi:hypothetical protein